MTLLISFFFFFGVNYWKLQSNNFMEGVSHKIRRQIEELERISGVESSALTVDGVPVDSYLTRYKYWDSLRLDWKVVGSVFGSLNIRELWALK